jgi:hypothetical protein
VLEPIAVALAVAVVTHHLGQAERTEHGAHPLHASANRAGDLTRVQLLIIYQQFNDCECYRIAEQAAQTRLPIAILFHAPSLSRFRNSENVENKRAVSAIQSEVGLRYKQVMTEVRFVDTTLRDGQQSLWAYNMRTGMMVAVADQIDDAGFEAAELGGPVEMPKCVKELREDPWERYRLIIPKFKKTPLRLIHGTRSGFAS